LPGNSISRPGTSKDRFDVSAATTSPGKRRMVASESSVKTKVWTGGILSTSFSSRLHPETTTKAMSSPICAHEIRQRNSRRMTDKYGLRYEQSSTIALKSPYSSRWSHPKRDDKK